MAKAALRTEATPLAERLRAQAAHYREKGYDGIAEDLERDAAEAAAMAKALRGGGLPTLPPRPRLHATVLARARPTQAAPRVTPEPQGESPLPPLRAKDYPPCPSSMDTVPSERLAFRTLLSVNDACGKAGVSRRTIYNWLAAGRLDHVRTAGGNVRIFEDSLFRTARRAAGAGASEGLT
jgi:excisionase family DNA binding protein